MADLPAADITPSFLPGASGEGETSAFVLAKSASECGTTNATKETIATKEAPPNKKGGGAPRSAPKRNRIDRRCGANPFSCLPTAGGPRPKTSSRLHKPWTSKNGAGALAFRRPTAASEVF